MATTTLLRIKSASTKSISNILKDRTEYIENDNKTNNKELVSSFNCTPESAYLDFTASKILYNEFKGTETKRKDDVLAYHLRQAFSPEDNITPEQAHEIGKKLVEQFTKGKHEYVIATHVDKKHIHNHIVFNSTTIDCTRKFNNYYNSAATIRKISDKLCRENNLSVVEPKAQKGQHYKEWQEDKKGESWKLRLKRNIDKCIECSGDFEEFKKAMQDLGYEIREGKHIAFRAKGQERFTRAKSLGDNYTQENISSSIKKSSINKNKCVDLSKVRKFPFTIDKQLLYAKRKQRISDVKLLANTLMLVRNENISSHKDFILMIDNLKTQSSSIKEDIKKLNNTIMGYRDTAKYLATISKNKEIHDKYEKCNVFRKKEFYSKYEGDILSYKHALKKLEEMGISANYSLDEIILLNNKYKLQVDSLTKEFSVIEKRIKDILKAKDVMNKIVGRKFENIVERNKSIENDL